jgi:DNA-binding MarR family transcriptional regulator
MAARRSTAAGTRFVEDYLSYLLAQASHVVYKEFDAQVRAVGLSPLEWRVLATLSDGDGLTIGELATRVLAKQPTLTRLIQRLVMAGFVRRADDGADLRRTLVFETAQGRRIVDDLLVQAKIHEAEILRAFGARNARALKNMLRAVISRSTARSARKRGAARETRRSASGGGAAAQGARAHSRMPP